jgi:hypothetical protein
MSNAITHHRHYRSTLHCFLMNVRNHPPNLLSGLQATMFREIPGNAIYFWAYRGTTRLLTKWRNSHSASQQQQSTSMEPSTWMVVVGGGMAGLTFWSTMYPIDLVKSMIQTRDVHSQYLAANATSPGTGTGSSSVAGHTLQAESNTLKLVYQRWYSHGFRSLYTGFSVTIPRAFLANATIFTTYELVRSRLQSVPYLNPELAFE